MRVSCIAESRWPQLLQLLDEKRERGREGNMHEFFRVSYSWFFVPCFRTARRTTRRPVAGATKRRDVCNNARANRRERPRDERKMRMQPRLKVNFENGFDDPRRESFPAVRFRNPRTLICRRGKLTSASRNVSPGGLLVFSQVILRESRLKRRGRGGTRDGTCILTKFYGPAPPSCTFRRTRLRNIVA